MLNAFAIVELPLLFVIDYVAVSLWLIRTSTTQQQRIHFRLRTLFVAMTIAAIHFGAISAFLSAQS